MPSPEPEGAMAQVAIIVAGAGLAGTAQGLVKGVLPSVTPEIGGALGGGLLYYFGRENPWARLLGVGIIAGSLSPMIAKLVGGIITPTTPTAGAGAAAQAGAGATALQQASAYLAMKGGLAFPTIPTMPALPRL